MASSPKAFSSDVFINCPFDQPYEQLFQALVFSVYYVGFRPRCAKEAGDSGEIRLNKITKIISECKYSIHDLSRTELDDRTHLPRFNMPLELGVDLGCRTFGKGYLQGKTFLILDRQKHRYEKFISDIKGQDIVPHNNDPRQMIYAVRDWLLTESKRTNVAGGAKVYEDYKVFRRWLPKRCAESNLEVQDLTYNEFTSLVYEWLFDHRR